MKLFFIAATALLLSFGTINTTKKDFSQKIEDLLSEEGKISAERKTELKELASEIHSQKEASGFSKVIFVCTHNSRRSQLAQIWFWRALEHFNMEGISSYSGGTEATAFNHRMVAALKRFGFGILQLDESKNPKYLIRSGKADEREMLLFSKKYADDFNPPKDFIAVMVCGQADAACPFVSGAHARFALPYNDPKASDNTPQESKVYDDKVLEIGREILFLVKHLE